MVQLYFIATLLRLLNLLGRVCCDISNITTTAVAPLCPDDEMESINYGNLMEKGPGRVLEIRGRDFFVNGDKVFLSGVKTFWLARGEDFGNNFYKDRKDTYECYLRKIHQAGGNTMRTQVHSRGWSTPEFDATGHVTGMDKGGTLITDLRQYLRAAAHYDIVVFLTLWETEHRHKRIDSLMKDESILQSYIDNALIPLVKALKDEPGLGGYEIMDNVEGDLIVDRDSVNPCFNTKDIDPGWPGESFNMQELLRFISRQADAIRRVDPSTPITAGSTNYKYNTDQFGFFNYHKDECLLKAGGRSQGFLSFYLTDAFGHLHYAGEPSKVNASQYQLDKPLVIGAFSEYNSHTMSTQEMYGWAYFHGYSGALSCCANYMRDSLATQMIGMEYIKSRLCQDLVSEPQKYEVPVTPYVELESDVRPLSDAMAAGYIFFQLYTAQARHTDICQNICAQSDSSALRVREDNISYLIGSSDLNVTFYNLLSRLATSYFLTVASVIILSL